MLSLLKHLSKLCLGFLLICAIISILKSENVNENIENQDIINNVILDENYENASYRNIENNIINNENNVNKKIHTSLRLPNNTIPLLYNLHFTFGNIFTTAYKTNFTGHTTIKVQVIESTSYIVLNSKDLTIFNIQVAHLKDNNQSNYSIISNIEYEIDTNSNLLVIFSKNFDYEFKENNYYIIDIKYEGLIENNKAKGLYVCSNSDNPVIVTIFAPTYARRAFPCFDEPFFKAKFVVQLTYSSQYYALSNSPVEYEYVSEISDNFSRRTTKFKETPSMSSYLVSFVIHPNYSHISVEENNVTYSIYYSEPEANEENLKIIKHTANEMFRIILKLENIFEIPYPLPKLDIIGVPDTTGAAIENWGLIIVKEINSLLNVTCKYRSDFYKAKVYTHELVHQWFGNLVTTRWWSDVWLHEGFATYYGNFLAMQLFPECEMPEMFAHLDMRVYKAQIQNEFPVSKYIEEEDKVMDLFSPTTYEQAAQIITMWENCLTKDVFETGLKNFLRNMQYSTATEDDLFSYLNEIVTDSGVSLFEKNPVDIKDFFKRWTNNFDVPQISVIRNYETHEINLKQSSMIEKNSDLWYIPINFASTSEPDFNDTKFTYIMNATNETIVLDAKKDLNIVINQTDWLFINKKGIGAYSVKYDKNNWLLLAKSLNENHSNFDVTSRIFILLDVLTFFDLAYFDENFDFEVVLEILSYLKFERDVAVWYHIERWLYKAYGKVEAVQMDSIFKKFLTQQVKWISEQVLSNKSSSNDNVMMNFLRRNFIIFLCTLQLDECLAQSHEKMKEFIENFVIDSNKNELDVQSLRNFYQCSGILLANKTEKFEILQIARNIPENGIFYRFVTLFYCTDDKEFAHEIIKLSLSKMFSVNTTDNEIDFIYDILSSYLKTESSVSWNLIIDEIENNFDKLMKNEEKFAKLLEVTRQRYLEPSYKDKVASIIQNFDEKTDYQYEIQRDTSVDALILKFRQYNKQMVDWISNYFKNFKTDL